MMNKIRKILVANRGEIAVRIMRTVKSMGISCVAVYTEQEKNAMHYDYADEAWSLGEGPLAETYLNAGRIVDIAKKSGADAIHPGYGFLSENPQLPKLCQEKGILFIGPSEEAIRIMGNKLQAAGFVKPLDVPLLSLKTGTPEEVASMVSEKDFPVIIKAAAGGGGKGMRIVRKPELLKETLTATAREAANYFNDPTVYIEKYIDQPRHIEIQVLADQHGHCIHLFERECSIQRRHQKIIEEAPSPTISNETRKKMGQAAVRIAKAAKYTGAGIVEFLVDEKENFYFLEMNTRIQVEHPVTEMITGIDLVREQILITEGQPMEWEQDDLQINGHAVEARVYAEDPGNHFMPSPGKVNTFIPPHIDGVRTDSGIRSNDRISAEFDPMVGKIIAWGPDRNRAIEQLRFALENTVITGIRHNLAYLQAVIGHGHFKENRINTHFIEQHHQELNGVISHIKQKADIPALLAAYIFIQSIPREFQSSEPAWKEIGYWRTMMEWSIILEEKIYPCRFTRTNNKLRVDLEGKQHLFELNHIEAGRIDLTTGGVPVRIFFSDTEKETEMVMGGMTFRAHHKGYLSTLRNKSQVNDHREVNREIIAPMFGKVLSIEVDENTEVKKGQTLMVLEAMKMENSIQAPHDTRVKHIAVKEGDQVKDGQVLLETTNN